MSHQDEDKMLDSREDGEQRRPAGIGTHSKPIETTDQYEDASVSSWIKRKATEAEKEDSQDKDVDLSLGEQVAERDLDGPNENQAVTDQSQQEQKRNNKQTEKSPRSPRTTNFNNSLQHKRQTDLIEDMGNDYVIKESEPARLIDGNGKKEACSNSINDQLTV